MNYDVYFTLEREMIDSSGYTLPKEALNQVYLSRIYIFFIGLAIPPLLGLSSISSMFDTALLIGVLVAGLYFYTKQYKWVYLSPRGILGLTPSGGELVIEWDEPVSLKQISAFSGIKGLAIQSAKNHNTLFLPSSIAETIEFQSQLNRLAPPNHPLRKASK